MAPRKKSPAKIKFELARSTIGGISVVVFCLFLWTFIFGVWAGQKYLVPQKRCVGKAETPSISLRKIEIVQDSPQNKEKSAAPPHIRADKKAIKARDLRW